jgi:hypothetical protein
MGSSALEKISRSNKGDRIKLASIQIDRDNPL